jgi:hypothetical protein
VELLQRVAEKLLNNAAVEVVRGLPEDEQYILGRTPWDMRKGADAADLVARSRDNITNKPSATERRSPF